MPAAGYYHYDTDYITPPYYTSFSDYGNYGYYWMSQMQWGSDKTAYYFAFSNNSCSYQYRRIRINGQSIRPVRIN